MPRRGSRSSQDTSDSQDATSSTITDSTTRATSKPAKSNVTISSFEIFGCCIERAKNLLKIHQAAHGKKAKPERYLADAHRAAIVLAISALDAFIRSFVVTRVRSILADKTTSLPGPLADRIKSFLKEDALLEAARKDDLLDRVEKAFRNDFARQSFQGTRQITESIKLVGYDDVFHDIAVSAGENEDTMRQRLDGFTNRRHAIAHVGDYDLSQNPPREQPITKKDALDCIKTITLVATHINKLRRRS
jgi:hypothetical protein